MFVYMYNVLTAIMLCFIVMLLPTPPTSFWLILFLAHNPTHKKILENSPALALCFVINKMGVPKNGSSTLQQ